MSGGEPMWRRVAGLYLSGIPADAGERLSTRAPAAAGKDAVEGEGDPAQQIVMLGEALDLVTLAQGYQSPAVPLLLRALIRTIRQVAAARSAAEAAPATAEAPAPKPSEAETAPEAEVEPKPKPEAEIATGAAEAARAKEAPAEPGYDTAMAALEKRVRESDQKLTALTAAVGQLVDVLQRRVREGGGVDRRASPRIPGDNAKIFIHDHPYEVVNWSKDGFQIRIADADRFSRGIFEFHFVLDLPDEVIEFQGRARPVRIERTTLAAAFVSLEGAAAQKIGDVASRFAAAV